MKHKATAMPVDHQAHWYASLMRPSFPVSWSLWPPKPVLAYLPAPARLQ